jgi:hypothetical protein
MLVDVVLNPADEATTTDRFDVLTSELTLEVNVQLKVEAPFARPVTDTRAWPCESIVWGPADTEPSVHVTEPCGTKPGDVVNWTFALTASPEIEN